MYSRRLYGAARHLCLTVQNSQAKWQTRTKRPPQEYGSRGYRDVLTPSLRSGPPFMPDGAELSGEMANQNKAPTAGMRRAKLWVCNDLNNTLTAQIIFVVAGEVDNAIALHLHHAGCQ
jgi:hypothetical protein